MFTERLDGDIFFLLPLIIFITLPKWLDIFSWELVVAVVTRVFIGVLGRRVEWLPVLIIGSHGPILIMLRQ